MAQHLKALAEQAQAPKFKAPELIQKAGMVEYVCNPSAVEGGGVGYLYTV